MSVINPEIASVAFKLLGNDFEELRRRIRQLDVDAEEAAAFCHHRKTLVRLDAQIHMQEWLQRPVDGDQFVVTQRSLLRRERRKMPYECAANENC